MIVSKKFMDLLDKVIKENWDNQEPTPVILSGWIPVNDRLQEENSRVIILYFNQVYAVGIKGQ